MKRRGFFAAVLIAAFAVGRPFAADGDDGQSGGGAKSGEITIGVPSFSARMSMGFNYDLLRSMTDVSFQYPVGYLGFNVPIGFSAGLGDFLGKETMDDMFSNGKIFKAGDRFKPTAAAEQNANYTVRVDVPMLAGVGTFAYTQNFFLNFSTALGGSSIIDSKVNIENSVGQNGSVDGFLSVRGALRLPIDFNMGWETMTLGYAYRVNNNDDLVFALNLHRHLFSADIRVKADIDILGHASISANNIGVGEGYAPMSMDFESELINFSSERCNGFAQGRFSAEAWTPSVGVKWKRFSLNSRFGLDTKATGSARGGFVIPRVVDFETGELLLKDKFESFAEKFESDPLNVFEMSGEDGGIIPKGLDSITYEIKDSFRWKMPQGHTLSFDIIPRKLSVSYTKLFGAVAVEMDNIVRTTRSDSVGTDRWRDPKNDTISVDVGVAVDHIALVSVSYPWFFANVGWGGLDIRSNGKYVLRDNKSLGSLRVGEVVMLLPIVNGGFNLGTKLQLRVEADILPLPAVRSGVNYYF
jgi:hypothetical protein